MKIDMKKALYCLLGLTFLQDSSADVTKLRLNQNVMNAFGREKECIYRGVRFVKVVDNGDFIFDSKTYLIKDEYKGAIFCKKNGEIIIVKNNNLFNIQQKEEERYTPLKSYKKSVPSKARKIKLNDIPFSAFRHDVLQREICKMQFENIIKSGLISGKKFNEQIYDASIFAAGVDWQMPGISADISNLNLSEIPVMCAAKTTCDNIDELWKRADWINFCYNKENVSKELQRFEHTERQFLAYYISGQRYGNNAWLSTGETINNNIGNSKQHYLIYTHGAPCFEEGVDKCRDNGGMCCWNLYRHCVPDNINVEVYFSDFWQYKLAYKDIRKNVLGNNGNSLIDKCCINEDVILGFMENDQISKDLGTLYGINIDDNSNIMSIIKCYQKASKEDLDFKILQEENMYRYATFKKHVMANIREEVAEHNWDDNTEFCQQFKASKVGYERFQKNFQENQVSQQVQCKYIRKLFKEWALDKITEILLTSKLEQKKQEGKDAVIQLFRECSDWSNVTYHWN